MIAALAALVIAHVTIETPGQAEARAAAALAKAEEERRQHSRPLSISELGIRPDPWLLNPNGKRVGEEDDE